LRPQKSIHYQLRRVIDVYVQPSKEDLGQVGNAIDKIVAQTKLPDGHKGRSARFDTGHALLVPPASASD